MKLIVISPSKTAELEPKQVTALFEHGLETFHLRKPSMRTKEMKAYLEAIPAHFHERIVIHSHHKLAAKYNLRGIHLTRQHQRQKIRTWIRLRLLRLRKPGLVVTTSFHRLPSVYQNKDRFDYVMLGTIFNQVDGKFNAGYNEHSLRAALSKSPIPIIARGGTGPNTIGLCNELGFAGVALYSSVWKRGNPVDEFVAIVNQCRELNIPVE
jgi:thiamine-phosphate pyrophosphorylase